MLPVLPSAKAATAMAPTPAKAQACIQGSTINITAPDNSDATCTIKAEASEDTLAKDTCHPGDSDLAQPFANTLLAAGIRNTNPPWSPAINVLNPDREIDFHSALGTRLDPPGSVPVSLPLLAAGAAFGCSRRLQRRLKPGQLFGNLDTLYSFLTGQFPAEPVFCEAGQR